MGLDKWSLLSRLRRAVKKLKILLSLDVSRWQLASMLGAVSRRQFSFNERPGLMECTEDEYSSLEDSVSSKGLQRTISYPSDQDDIDKRAEMFIANFHKQLQIERQISLELKYYNNRTDSFKLMSP